MGLQHLQYALGRARGVYGDRGDYWVAWLLDPTPVILWGRFLATLLSAGIVAVGALLGRRLAGTAGLVTAGLGLALSPLLVRHAQLIDPDGWVGLFAALAVLRIVAVADRGRVRDYLLAGLWIGLGTAAKYTPVLLALSLAAVHLERRRAEGGDLRRLGLDDRRLWLAAAAAVAAFAIASPYTLLDLGVLRRDLAWQGEHLAKGHFGQVGQGSGWLHYLLRVLPAALGWPLLLAGLAGLVVAARRGPRTRALVWCVLPLLLVLGALHTRFDRYMIPLLAPLAAAAGLLWAPVRARLPQRASRGAAVLAAALLLALPASATVRYLRVQARPSTGVEAAAWLREHVDAAHQAVLTERYGPELAPDLRDALQSGSGLPGPVGRAAAAAGGTAGHRPPDHPHVLGPPGAGRLVLRPAAVDGLRLDRHLRRRAQPLPGRTDALPAGGGVLRGPGPVRVSGGGILVRRRSARPGDPDLAPGRRRTAAPAGRTR